MASGGDAGLFTDEVYGKILWEGRSGSCVFEVSGDLESSLRTAEENVASDHGNCVKELVLLKRGEEAEDGGGGHRRFEECFPLLNRGDHTRTSRWDPLPVENPRVVKYYKEWFFESEGGAATQGLVVRVLPISPLADPGTVPVSKVNLVKGKLEVTLAGNSPKNTTPQNFVVTLSGHCKVDGTYCISTTKGNNTWVIRYGSGNIADGTLYDSAFEQTGPPVTLTFSHVVNPSATLYHVLRGQEKSILAKPGREMMEWSRGEVFGGPPNQHGGVQHPAEISQINQDQQWNDSRMSGAGPRNQPWQGAANNVWGEPPGHHGGQNTSQVPPTAGNPLGTRSAPAPGTVPDGQVEGTFYGAPQMVGQGQFQGSMERMGNTSHWGHNPSFPAHTQANSSQGDVMGQGSADLSYGRGQDRAGFEGNGSESAVHGGFQVNSASPAPGWGGGEVNHPAPSVGSQSGSGGGGGWSDHQSNASGGQRYPPTPQGTARQDPVSLNAGQDVHNAKWRTGQEVAQSMSANQFPAQPASSTPPNQQAAHPTSFRSGSSDWSEPGMLKSPQRTLGGVADGQASVSSRTDPFSGAPVGVRQPSAPQQTGVDPKTLRGSNSDEVRLLRGWAKFSGNPFTHPMFQRLCTSNPEMRTLFRVLLSHGYSDIMSVELGNATPPPPPEPSPHAPHQASKNEAWPAPQPAQERSPPKQPMLDMGSQAGSDSMNSYQSVQPTSSQTRFSFNDLVKPLASDREASCNFQQQHMGGHPNPNPGGGHLNPNPGAVAGGGQVQAQPTQYYPHQQLSNGGLSSYGNPGLNGGGNEFVGMARGEIPGQPLRSYQRDAVEQVTATGQNYLVKAPTGSGKTRMFVEAARRLLMVNREARIIVVVPTVPLTDQQKNKFDEAGFTANGYRTQAYFGGHKLDRSQMLENTVLLMTVKILENKLDDKTIRFSDFQMLVLDEAHHVRGASSYANVLKKYRLLPSEMQAKVQVLGFTASPTHGTGVCEASNSLHTLLEEMCVPVSNLIDISDQNEEVNAQVPRATEELIEVDARSLDVDFRTAMTAFLRAALRIYHDFLKEKGLGAVLSVHLPKKMKPGECSSDVEDWRKRASTAIDIEKESGAPISDALESNLKEGLEVISTVNFALDEVAELGCEVVLQRISSGVGKRVDHKSPVDAARVADRLVRKLWESPGVRMAEDAPPVEGLGPTTAACGTLPRFACLLDVLCRERFQGPEFHCLIFVRVVSAVNEICRMLETSLRVNQSMEFRAYMGHGQKRRRQQLQGNPNSSSAILGMTPNQQNDIVTWFSGSGRKVLVATSAAEEGLDIRSCELVVRYSVTVTGVERIQSRGRARKKGALYVNIVEKNSKDARLYKRSKNQEDSGEAMLSTMDSIQM